MQGSGQICRRRHRHPHKGTVFIRLHIGLNAVAHSCYDDRLPGKKDEVSFVVTRIDEERNVAVGLIFRIISQNI